MFTHYASWGIVAAVLEEAKVAVHQVRVTGGPRTSEPLTYACQTCSPDENGRQVFCQERPYEPEAVFQQRLSAFLAEHPGAVSRDVPVGSSRKKGGRRR